MNDSSKRHMRGQALLQFALVAPMMMLLVFSVIELGRVFYDTVSSPITTHNASFGQPIIKEGLPDPPPGCHRLMLDPNTIYGGVVAIIDPGTSCPADNRFYDDGTVVMFYAIPRPHYAFIEWQDDAVGNNITNTVTMTENKSVVAVFESSLECHFLDTTITPNNAAGTIHAITQYNCEENFRDGWLEGTLVRLNAIPSVGYSFVDWSGDAYGIDNPTDVLFIQGDQQITANFVANQCHPFAVTPVPAAGGSYEATPAQNCPGGWSNGTVVTLNAIPNSGYTFYSWEGYATGVNPITMTMAVTQVENIDLSFRLQCHFLDTTITPNNAAGTIVPITSYNCHQYFRDGWLEGTVVRLNAVASFGYSFIDWSGDANGNENPIDVLFTGGDQQITANFASECRPLAVTPVPAAGGTYEATPAQNCPDGWLNGTVVTLNALPDYAGGYTFDSWEGYAWGVNPITITMAVTQVESIDLYFYELLECYTLSVMPSPLVGGYVTPMPAQNCVGGWTDGSIVALYAIPNPGYDFVNWSGDANGEDSLINVLVDQDLQITANFASECRPLAITPIPAAGGTYEATPAQNCSGGWLNGTVMTLNALPDDAGGYTFDSWEGYATGVNPVTMTMTVTQVENIDLYFNAPPECHTLSVTPVPAAGGSAFAWPEQNCVGGWVNGTVLNLYALPNVGYMFNSWENHAPGINPIMVTMTNSLHLEAFFDELIELTINMDGNGAGVVISDPLPMRCSSGRGYHCYENGTVVTLTAVSDPYSTFTGWGGNCTGMECVVTMDAARNVTATFVTYPVFLPVIWK